MNARFAILGAAFGLLGCGAPESDPAAKPTFAKINSEIFEPNCTFACHSGGEFAAGGLDMKTDPYATLVGKRAVAAACKSSSLARVEPGKPEASLVYLKIVSKLDDKAAPCGDGMPAGADRHALATDQIEAISTWIQDGAKND